MRPLIVLIMNSLLTSVIVIVVVVLCLSRTSDQYVVPSTVTLDIPNQGTIQGDYETTLWSQQTFMRFRGIPFAESPRGPLRFKPPIKRLPWRHVLDATTYGRRCPVITTISQLSNAEMKQDLEDCLNLCVYTKNLTAKMPVMFYIYGGGFYNGSNIDHPPRHLLEKDVVLVVPNYRIGALGWLSTLSEEMPGNAPVGDLLLALQWVQDYIHLFGGDPKQVTIFGQSAGTAMSGVLLFSPNTPIEYFQRSIVQSGSIFGTWAINREPLEQVKRICSNLMCDKCESKQELYECLRNVKVSKLLEVTQSESFAPIMGDFYEILPSEPESLLKDFNRSVPIMTGFTKHDGTFVLASYYDAMKSYIENLNTVSVRDFAKGLLDMSMDNTGLSKNLLTKLLFSKNLLDSNDHKNATPAYFDLTSIIAMKSPVLTLAKNMLNKNLAPVYLYSFDYEGSNTRFGYEFGNEHYPFEGGVHHSNDNIYLFSTHHLNEEDTKMAMKMVEIWTSFAIEGKPHIQNDIEILPMKTDSGPYFRINSDISLGQDVYEELTITIDDPNNERFIRKDIEF
ncbi:glutactin [Lucilia cuprina]|uniref:glutactin n=1 Tax=Lucilia cuprina TaxID=7375 RepID=UPI000C719E81|nr:glutactin [Lucilia cuprina]